MSALIISDLKHTSLSLIFEDTPEGNVRILPDDGPAFEISATTINAVAQWFHARMRNLTTPEITQHNKVANAEVEPLT